jgi:hypothetical protein
VFHGPPPAIQDTQPVSSAYGDVPTETHGADPASFAAGGAEAGTAVNEEPDHSSSGEQSFEDAHSAATADAGGHTGYDGGADPGQDVHHV